MKRSCTMEPEPFDVQYEVYESECPGCDFFLPVGDVGLCAACSAMCERDLLRMRDWEYSTSSYGLTAAQRETLRKDVVREHGERNELLSPSGDAKVNSKRQRRRRA